MVKINALKIDSRDPVQFSFVQLDTLIRTVWLTCTTVQPKATNFVCAIEPILLTNYWLVKQMS